MLLRRKLCNVDIANIFRFSLTQTIIIIVIVRRNDMISNAGPVPISWRCNKKEYENGNGQNPTTHKHTCDAMRCWAKLLCLHLLRLITSFFGDSCLRQRRIASDNFYCSMRVLNELETICLAFSFCPYIPSKTIKTENGWTRNGEGRRIEIKHERKRGEKKNRVREMEHFLDLNHEDTKLSLSPQSICIHCNEGDRQF